MLIGIFQHLVELHFKSTSVQDELILAGHEDQESRTLAILVDKDTIDNKVFTLWQLLGCNECRCLFYMIIEIPESDLFARSYHQLVVFVIQVNCLCVCLELEQKLFRDQIILVNQAIHGDQEKVSVWLRTHGHIADL